VDFGLAICCERDHGYGLKTTVAIPSNSPITQYEGIVISKSSAEKIRKEEKGKILGSHFASTSPRLMVINGYSYRQPAHNSDEHHGGVPLTPEEWTGRGGGSMCNHDDMSPNAELVRDSNFDGYGIFVVSLRDIDCGEFIRVDYGKGFTKSIKSNI
jgi:hypothetical protein